MNLAGCDLCPRMKLPMYGFEPLLIDVRIDLRGRNVRVPEHFLDDAQVGAVAEQMRRKTVTEKMRIDIFFQPGVSRVLLNNLPDARGR